MVLLLLAGANGSAGAEVFDRPAHAGELLRGDRKRLRPSALANASLDLEVALWLSGSVIFQRVLQNPRLKRGEELDRVVWSFPADARCGHPVGGGWPAVVLL